MPGDTQRGAFFQDDPAYHGCIASAGDVRLIVSPNGKRYALQERAASGRFAVRRWRKRLSLLLPDLPDSITGQGLRHCPDDPAEYPRPWASAMAAQRRRLRRACTMSDDYSGVLVPGASYRVAVLVKPRRYVLQERKASGSWRGLRSRATAPELADTLGRLVSHAGERSRLAEGLARLPVRSSDYGGPLPELYSDARRSLGADGRHHAERRPQSGMRPDSAGERPLGRSKVRRGSHTRKAATALQQAHKRAQGQA